MAIKEYKKYQGYFLLVDALRVSDLIVEFLRSHECIKRCDIAGSVRRHSEIVKELDVVVAGDDAQAVVDTVLSMPGIETVNSKGLSKVSVRLASGMNMDVRIVKPNEFYSALHHFTGSKEHHIKLCGLANSRSLKISEYNLKMPSGEIKHITSESELYEQLGIPYIVPELREDRGEVEAAQADKLPRLVQLEDVQGILHIHTTYSDGRGTLSEMVNKAKARGYSYIGITDHSQSAFYAKGLKYERIIVQQEEIRELNEKISGITVLSGIEADILPNGELDYPDEILKGFDFVIASVHSAFRQSEEEMTKRLIKAMQNPYVSILGHPTGRILLARPGYKVAMKELINAAVSTGTVLEINASPYRLDLDWRWCMEAKAQGAKFALNPDAHAVEELEYITFGVYMARKGWLSKSDIINTYTVDKLKTYFMRKHT